MIGKEHLGNKQIAGTSYGQGQVQSADSSYLVANPHLAVNISEKNRQANTIRNIYDLKGVISRDTGENIKNPDPQRVENCKDWPGVLKGMHENVNRNDYHAERDNQKPQYKQRRQEWRENEESQQKEGSGKNGGGGGYGLLTKLFG